MVLQEILQSIWKLLSEYEQKVLKVPEAEFDDFRKEGEAELINRVSHDLKVEGSYARVILIVLEGCWEHQFFATKGGSEKKKLLQLFLWLEVSECSREVVFFLKSKLEENFGSLAKLQLYLEVALKYLEGLVFRFEKEGLEIDGYQFDDFHDKRYQELSKLIIDLLGVTHEQAGCIIFTVGGYYNHGLGNSSEDIRFLWDRIEELKGFGCDSLITDFLYQRLNETFRPS